MKSAAREALAVIEERTRPADLDGIKAAVYVLLSHFYTADLPENVYKAIAADWLHCLKDYPAWAIEQARIEYLKTSTKKPTPASLVTLCSKAVSKDFAMKMQCQRILDAPLHVPPPDITEEEREASIRRVAVMVADAKRKLTGGMTKEEREASNRARAQL